MISSSQDGSGRKTVFVKPGAILGLSLSIIALLAHTECLASSRLAVSTTSNDMATHQSNQISGAEQTLGDIIAIKEGADLDLSCPIVVPDEDMIISWTCENEPANIRSSRIHVTDSGKLRIISARAGDSCNYRCEAANGFGTLSVVIKVIIVEKRLIDQLTSRRTNSLNASSYSGPDHMAHLSQSAGSAEARVQVIGDRQIPPAHGANRAEVALRSGKDSQAVSDTNFEMQIEPSRIHARKNSTFSLECRIKYAPQIAMPQIVWLKEFMGPKPVSLADALEQNLILLEDVYYHSLNWPRSVTYSDTSLAASSALLIRQSNFVHSGRYVCLAGYPSAIMNLQLNKADHGVSHTSTSEQMKSPLRFRTAQAFIEVDDEEGKLNHQLSLDSLASRKGSEQSSLIASVLYSNSWMRNLAILLCLLCIALMLYKLIQLKKRPNKTAPKARLETASGDHNSLRLAGSRGNDPEIGDANGATRSDLTTMSRSDLVDISSRRNQFKIDENLLKKKLMTLNSRDIDQSTEHVYSEIGIISNSDRRPSSTSEPYYKQPIPKPLRVIGDS